MKKLYFWLIILCLKNNFTLSISIEKYFKKPLGKAGNHSIKNIDFIYVINLDKRPEKWLKMVEQSNLYNINPYRFSAIYSLDLDINTINDVGVKLTSDMSKNLMGTSYEVNDDGTIVEKHSLIKEIGKTYFCHCLSRRAIACSLSHLSVLQDALDCNYKTIWVMEDDAEFLSDPNEISHKIEQLNKLVGENNWDILFTDLDTRDSNGNYIPAAGYIPAPNFNPKNPSQYSLKKRINNDFSKIGARFGSYSMIITRSGIEKILSFSKKYSLFVPYDILMYLPEGINMHCLNRPIVVHPIQNIISDNS